MLRVELRAALFRAAQTNAPVEVFRVPVDTNGSAAAVDIRVAPAQEIAPDYLLVVFSLREDAALDRGRRNRARKPSRRCAIWSARSSR